MRVLVVGYGSIGQRHVRLLADMGCQVAVVSQHPTASHPRYYNLLEALVDWQPNYVVVANRTSHHYKSLQILIEQGFKGQVLVEKPLFDCYQVLHKHQFLRAAVAYNFRFHPLIQKLKALLDSASSLVSANIYVGSYLPNWRSQIDYRQSYSAHKHQGGGVLRDLSHELDYALWLLGLWKRLTAIGGQFSSLEIDSEDVYSLLMETTRCPVVTIHLNYLDLVPRRDIVINTNRCTIKVDLCQNTIDVNGDREMISLERDDTYRAEHRAMLSGRIAQLCTFEEALQTLATIEAAEQASRSHIWIER